MGHVHCGDGSGDREGVGYPFVKEAQVGAIRVRARLSRDIRGRGGQRGSAETSGDIGGVPSSDGEGAEERPVVGVCPSQRMFHVKSGGSEDKPAEEEMVDGIDGSVTPVMCGDEGQAQFSKGRTKI